MQINLELRIPIIVASTYIQYQFASTLKYSWIRPWLFKWPDYEEEDQYQDDGQQDVYDNQDRLLTSSVACGADGRHYVLISAVLFVVDPEIDFCIKTGS